MLLKYPGISKRPSRLNFAALFSLFLIRLNLKLDHYPPINNATVNWSALN